MPKSNFRRIWLLTNGRFSTLQRVEIAETVGLWCTRCNTEKFQYSSTSRNCRNLPQIPARIVPAAVSVLFNESKLPKSRRELVKTTAKMRFQYSSTSRNCRNPFRKRCEPLDKPGFSTLQRVEIAEIGGRRVRHRAHERVSVLFNESKLPKSSTRAVRPSRPPTFQYSSTSRNCRNHRHSPCRRRHLAVSVDFINVYFDFQHTFCVSIAFGSCVARNTFP